MHKNHVLKRLVSLVIASTTAFVLSVGINANEIRHHSTYESYELNRLAEKHKAVYTYTAANYNNLDVVYLDKMIPSSTTLVSLGIVNRGQSKIVYEITLTYRYITESTAPVTFTFQNINTSSVKLMSSSSVTVIPDGEVASVDATYHVLGDINFTPVASVSINGSVLDSFNETINFDAYEFVRYESQFKITGYITALESDPEYQGGTIQSITAINKTNNTSITLNLTSSFISALNLQGSAYLNDGRLIQYGNGSYSVYPAGTTILGATSTPVIADETCAVDDYYVIRHGGNNKFSELYVGGFEGYLIANDAGGGITQYKIDIYCGAMTENDFYNGGRTWGSTNQYVFLSGMMGYNASTKSFYSNP